jgi:hypothetical protein
MPTRLRHGFGDETINKADEFLRLDQPGVLDRAEGGDDALYGYSEDGVIVLDDIEDIDLCIGTGDRAGFSCRYAG